MIKKTVTKSALCLGNRVAKTGFLGLALMCVLLAGSFDAIGHDIQFPEDIGPLLLLLAMHDAEAIEIESERYIYWLNEDMSNMVVQLQKSIAQLESHKANICLPETSGADRKMQDAFFFSEQCLADSYRRILEDPAQFALAIEETFPGCVKAVGVFQELANKRISCVYTQPPNGPVFPDLEVEEIVERIPLLEEYMMAGYSTDIVKAWRNWRGLHQGCFHGMSNSSEIPNAFYEKKRKDVATVIITHLLENSDDIVAAEQLRYLAWSPCITRGGQYGNSALMEWHRAQ